MVSVALVHSLRAGNNSLPSEKLVSLADFELIVRQIFSIVTVNNIMSLLSLLSH